MCVCVCVSVCVGLCVLMRKIFLGIWFVCVFRSLHFAFMCIFCTCMWKYKCFRPQWIFPLLVCWSHSCFRKLFKQLACNVASLCMCVCLCGVPMFNYCVYGVVSLCASSPQSSHHCSLSLSSPHPRLTLAASHWEIKRRAISCGRIEVVSSPRVCGEAVTAAFSPSCNMKDPSLSGWVMCVILSDVFILLQFQLSFSNVTEISLLQEYPY